MDKSEVRPTQPDVAATRGVLIVVGTSAGGLNALRTMIAGLPRDLPAAICVVQHIGGHASCLPSLLGTVARLHVLEAEDDCPIEAGVVYVAPPSQHLLVGPGHLHLTHGPRENFARPAIDPLFRSAAEHFGPRAIGVILTGQLNDGTAGLYEIKRRGGFSVVQDPADAEYPGMPQSAVDHVAIDYRISLSALADLLEKLATDMTLEAQEIEIMTSHLPHERQRIVDQLLQESWLQPREAGI